MSNHWTVPQLLQSLGQQQEETKSEEISSPSSSAVVVGAIVTAVALGAAAFFKIRGWYGEQISNAISSGRRQGFGEAGELIERGYAEAVKQGYGVTGGGTFYRYKP